MQAANSNKPAIEMTIRFEGRDVVLPGREAWAMENLLRQGEKGCTPIDVPGPRWSSYIHKLRRRGLIIETVTEVHSGAFAGKHARYVLHSPVEVVSVVREGDKRDAA